jgi:ABC-type uncharacterized transport system permease subunit
LGLLFERTDELDTPLNKKFINPVIKFVKSLMIPIGSVFLASLVGGGILYISGSDPLEAYSALLKGAFGNMSSITRTLEKATPLILNGLAVAFALKAGLFNIGTQGQFLFGALAAAVAGFFIQGVSPVFHIPIAMTAGILGGGLYGALQGALKAYSGAHEVITGIMCNYIAINITDYLVNHPFRDTSPGNIVARTPLILETSFLPDIAGLPGGFFISLIAAILVWWILKNTVLGFEITMVGAGINAARYSGVRIQYVLMITMLLSGALAGLGGAIETQGVVHRFQPGFNIGLGFEGITIALLGRVHPLGIIPAALLIGAMKAGASMMQFSAGVESEIIDIIQALILFFVTADMIVQRVIPGMRGQKGKKLSLSAGWGGHS